MAAPVINTPAHLEHRIKTPDGRTLAVAESLSGLQVAEEAGPAINVVVGASDMRLCCVRAADKRIGQTGGLSAPSAIKAVAKSANFGWLRCNSTHGVVLIA